MIRRHPFGSFVLLAFAWTWPLAAMIEQSLAFPLLALFGPLIAAVSVLSATEGTSALRDLTSRFRITRRHLPWLALALLLPLGMLIPVWLLAGEAGAFRITPIAPIGLLLALLIVGEEVGWRGYALPALLERHAAARASLIVGAVWALWHLPNFFFPGYPHQGTPFSAFAITVLAYSVLFTWFHLRTGGNLTVAVLLHAALNLFAVEGIDPVRQSWLEALVYGVLAIVLIAARELKSKMRPFKEKT